MARTQLERMVPQICSILHSVCNVDLLKHSVSLIYGKHAGNNLLGYSLGRWCRGNALVMHLSKLHVYADCCTQDKTYADQCDDAEGTEVMSIPGIGGQITRFAAPRGISVHSEVDDILLPQGTSLGRQTVFRAMLILFLRGSCLGERY